MVRAKAASISLDVQVDRDFARLAPGDRIEKADDWQIEMQEQASAARQLAIEWLALPPAEFAHKLVWCVRESRHQQHRSRDYSDYVCAHIAAEVPASIPWLDALIAEGAPAECVLPFLDRAFSHREDGSLDCVSRCLRTPELETAALMVLLPSPPLSDEIDKEIIEKARRNSQLVEHLCFLARIPTQRLRQLLSDSDERLAGTTAAGIWGSRATPRVAPELTELWRQAVIRGDMREFDLRKMFEFDSALAYMWLLDRSLHQRKKLSN